MLLLVRAVHLTGVCFSDDDFLYIMCTMYILEVSQANIVCIFRVTHAVIILYSRLSVRHAKTILYL